MAAQGDYVLMVTNGLTVLVPSARVMAFSIHGRPSTRWTVGVYGAIVVALFAFFYPVLAGTKVTYTAWYQRMWPDRMGIPGTSWIIPHRNP